MKFMFMIKFMFIMQTITSAMDKRDLHKLALNSNLIWLLEKPHLRVRCFYGPIKLRSSRGEFINKTKRGHKNRP